MRRHAAAVPRRIPDIVHADVLDTFLAQQPFADILDDEFHARTRAGRERYIDVDGATVAADVADEPEVDQADRQLRIGNLAQRLPQRPAALPYSPGRGKPRLQTQRLQRTYAANLGAQPESSTFFQ